MRTGLQTVNMPMAGLGTWLSASDDVERAVEAALEAGVRLIDTATLYGNEGNIGKVLAKWIDAGKILHKNVFFSKYLI